MIEFLRKLLAWLTSPKSPSTGNETVLEIPPAQEWITPEQFRLATGLPEHRANDWYGHVRAACLEFGIRSNTRIAAFLAQVGHESVSFTHTVEIWGPTAARKRN